MLELNDIHVHYGHIHALRGISLKVREGKIISLLGSNGAGKSTTLKTISRLLDPTDGTYKINNENALNKNPKDIVKLGIIHCPEGRRVFPLLTVEENLKLGAYQQKNKTKIKENFKKVFEYFPRLKERIDQKAGTLSGGEQQMLAIGRSLMGNPKVLLLDEPSLGLAPILVKEIFNIIKEINKQGTSILLVEQNAFMAMEISDYVYILKNGNIELEGHPNELKYNDEVRQLYLGG